MSMSLFGRVTGPCHTDRVDGVREYGTAIECLALGEGQPVYYGEERVAFEEAELRTAARILADRKAREARKASEARVWI